MTTSDLVLVEWDRRWHGEFHNWVDVAELNIDHKASESTVVETGARVSMKWGRSTWNGTVVQLENRSNYSDQELSSDEEDYVPLAKRFRLDLGECSTSKDDSSGDLNHNGSSNKENRETQPESYWVEPGVDEVAETIKEKQKTKIEISREIQSKRQSGHEFSMTRKDGSSVTVATRRAVPEDSPCKGKCRRSCSTISYEDRKRLNTKFYDIGDRERKEAFLLRYFRWTDIVGSGRRKRSVFYKLPKDNDDDVSVCKAFFLKTFNISESLIYSLINRTQDGVLQPLQSGGRRNSENDDVLRKSVTDHINRFPQSTITLLPVEHNERISL